MPLLRRKLPLSNLLRTPGNKGLLMTTATRLLKTAVVLGLAASLVSCASARRVLPFGLGQDRSPSATASAGERMSILSFDQQLMPSAGLAGRDFFLPGPVSATAWANPGGSAENSVEHVIAAPQFQIAWRRKIGTGSGRDRQVMSPVVAADGRIYVMDGESTVTAVDAGTGAVVWRADVKPTGREAVGGVSAFGLPVPFVSQGGGSLSGGFGGGVAVSGGRVFVSSGYRTMTALDAATGAVAWAQTVDSPIHGAPTVSGNRVFVIDVDNLLMAFNATTGLQDWSSTRHPIRG